MHPRGVRKNPRATTLEERFSQKQLREKSGNAVSHYCRWSNAIACNRLSRERVATLGKFSESSTIRNFLDLKTLAKISKTSGSSLGGSFIKNGL